MKILASEVQMESSVTKYFDVNVESNFSFKQQLLGIATATENPEDANIEKVEDPQEAKKLLGVNHYEDDLTEFQRISKLIIELLLERFFGLSPEEAKMYPKEKSTKEVEAPEKKLVVKNEFHFERTIEYTKEESMEFSSKAIIKTADKDIEVDLNLGFSQSFYEKHHESIDFEEVAFLDPLVIDYKGENGLDMIDTEMSFMFDLDADGTEDEIPLLKDGSGFLALDKNSNGSIDDGNELFGPQTNNGFEELRAYDSDGNDWIDENDAIFSDLRIWSKDANGEDQLIGLGESGVGALYLSSVDAGLTYNKSVNEELAHLKSNSIFLKEDGTAGLLSSLDFIA
mgnify:CR=1 FL=1